jgi:hypothetical protein
LESVVTTNFRFRRQSRVIFAHDAIDALLVYDPAAAAEFLRHPPPPISGPFQCDALNGVAQIHVRVGPGFGVLVEAVVAGPAHAGQLHHPPDGQSPVGFHFFPRFSGRPRIPSQRLQHPLFLDALQAPFQKIDLQRLLADLPFQIRYPTFRPPRLSIAGKCVTGSLAELPAPAVQHIRVHFQPTCYLRDRYPLFQPPDGGQFKLLRELPAYCTHDSILHSLDFES